MRMLATHHPGACAQVVLHIYGPVNAPGRCAVPRDRFSPRPKNPAFDPEPLGLLHLTADA